MKISRDFKNEAKTALRGKWPEATVAFFLYSFLSSLLFTPIVVTAIIVVLAARRETSGVGMLYETYRFEILDNPYSISGQLVIILVAGLVATLTIYIIAAMLQVGLYKIYLDLYREPGSKPKLKTLFTGVKYTFKVIGYYVVLFVKVTLWSLLLVVPGIMKLYSYSMTPFLLADEPELGLFEAMSKSEEMMKGNRWRYFCLVFSFIGWMLLVAVSMYLPIVNLVSSVAMYVVYTYMFVAQAAFYLEISGKGNRLNSFIENNESTEYTY